jgi:hypothetical protein
MLAVDEQLRSAPPSTRGQRGLSPHLHYIPSWWAVPCGGTMLRLKVFQFYRFGHAVRLLGTLHEKSRPFAELTKLLDAKRALSELLQPDHPLVLNTSKPPIEALVALINELLSPILGEGDERVLDVNVTIRPEYLKRLMSALLTFETVFEAELEGRNDTYIVSKKGIYDTADLIEGAHHVLPEEILTVFPDQVTQDIKDAGRCLAFELSTACGFHLMRAVESAIHTYYTEATGHTPKRKDRNWGAYVRNLRSHIKDNIDSKVDTKLIALIDQIREHHRNVLMHPEERLELEEAVSLFGISQSAIIAFARGIRVVKM